MNNSFKEYIKPLKIVILGEPSVGKSSIAQRYVNGNYTSFNLPTLGALFMKKQIIKNDKEIKLEIWDTAGEEKYRSLTPIYYKRAKAAIVVFDITNNNSFDSTHKWIKEINEMANSGITVCICGNKSDLNDIREVDKERAEKYANSLGSLYFEVSAKSNTNIEEMFNQIIDNIPGYMLNEGDIIKINDIKEKLNNNGNVCVGNCSQTKRY